MNIIAYKYSRALTKEDIVELFEMLQRNESLSEVCRRIGIDEKTVCNWDKVKELRDETKVKVLAEALRVMPLETLEFLADRSIDRSVEIIAHLLSIVYEDAMSTEDRKEFKKKFVKFRDIVSKYDISLVDKVRGEVNKLLYRLDEKARKLGVYSSIIAEGIE